MKTNQNLKIVTNRFCLQLNSRIVIFCIIIVSWGCCQNSYFFDYIDKYFNFRFTSAQTSGEFFCLEKISLAQNNRRKIKAGSLGVIYIYEFILRLKIAKNRLQPIFRQKTTQLLTLGIFLWGCLKGLDTTQLENENQLNDFDLGMDFMIFQDFPDFSRFSDLFGNPWKMKLIWPN